jgi:phytoene synthase
MELFQNLLAAFRSDVINAGFETFDDLVAYCRNSANPIGRLILLLFNYRNESMMLLSDHICTALQLTNFWQDLSVDIKNNRIYFPRQDMAEYHYTEEHLLAGTFDRRFKSLLVLEMRRTMDFYLEGRPLIELVQNPLRVELGLTWRGGVRIMEKIQKHNFEALTYRPTLSLADKFNLLFHVIRAK